MGTRPKSAFGRAMFAAVRRYVGLDAAVIDFLGENAPSIRRALTSTGSSTGCEVIATREGVLVVATGPDEAAVVEAGRRFVAWLDGHLPAMRDTDPEVWAGEVLVHGLAASAAEGGRS